MTNILGDDEPIRLDEACATILKGRLTVRALQKEARKGNLDLIKIANKHFVTPAALREMLERCRVETQNPTSTKRRPSREPPTGSSGTSAKGLRRDALRMTLLALGER